MIEIVKELKEANCVTHGGKFHSDEIFATVILSKILTNIKLIRVNEVTDSMRESVKLNTDTIVSVSDIIKTLIDVGAFNKKPSDMDIKTALSNLAKFNIIQKVDGKFEDPETKIIIFPSILFAVTNEKITALSQTISILEENVEDDENEEEEDSEE